MIISSKIYLPSDQILQEAAARLRDGHLVAMPTETVYGLAADATNDRAVASIFALKERPAFNPLIIHVPSADKAWELIEKTDLGHAFAQAFWPGPLTLVGKKHKVSPLVPSLLCSGGLETLAVRVPAHPIAQKLLTLAEIPLAAPSANPSTKLSPTSAYHVQRGFPRAQELWILDGGDCSQGLESTVVDITEEFPIILRLGTVTASNIEKALGLKPVYYKDTDGASIKSPGQMLKHYAPHKPMRLNVTDVKPGEGLLAFGSDNIPAAGVAYNLSQRGDMLEAAQNLFKMLHLLDQEEKITGIAVMPIPLEGLGGAINDRLSRTQS